MSHVTEQVGTTLLFENQTVRVWKLELAPGQETPLHRHAYSYIWYALSGGPLHCQDEHCNDLRIIDVPTGSVFDIHYDQGELEIASEVMNGTRFPAIHKAKNVGNTLYSEIMIELKK